MPLPLPYSDLAPVEPTPLQMHLQQCTFATGHVHRLRCMAEATGAFMAPRLISLLVIVLLGGVALSLHFGAA